MLYKTDGRASYVAPAGATWSLAELQRLVGGDIEIVRTIDDRYMVINEQGKFQRLPLNIYATRLFVHGRRDVIMGPAVVVDTKLELDGPDC
jgi:hypothetical protein